MSPFHNFFGKDKFLSLLTDEEKVEISTFPPVFYRIISKKKTEPKVLTATDNKNAVLARLTIAELEQLALSAEAEIEGDDLLGSNDSEARASYKKATEINPYNDRALMKYAFSLANKGNFREGMKWAEKAIQLNPKNMDAVKSILDAHEK